MTVEELRAKALDLVQADPNKMALRSCWECNPAHAHFKEGTWGDWVLCCFSCGRYFFEGVDITEHDEPTDSPGTPERGTPNEGEVDRGG